MDPTRVRRALVSLGLAAALYGLAAQGLHGVLPTRVALPMHEVEGVELLPSLPSLWEEAVFLVQAGILLPSAAVSAGRVLAGLLLGAVVGVLVGIATGRARSVEYLAEPWLALLRFTPALALLPLYVLWFGFGEPSRILLVATAVAVVAHQGTHEGVRGVPALYLEGAAALGAAAPLTLRRVVLPAALPQIMASVRVALGLGWVTLVVAELIRPSMPSLGYLLVLAGAYPRVPTMLVALVTMGLLVLVSDGLVLLAYYRLTRWMRRHHDQG